MNEMTTTDLAKFGSREKAMEGDLLTYMSDHGLPDDFNDCVSLIDKTNKQKLTQIDFQQWTSGDVSSIDTAGNTTHLHTNCRLYISLSLLLSCHSPKTETTATLDKLGLIRGGEWGCRRSGNWEVVSIYTLQRETP